MNFEKTENSIEQGIQTIENSSLETDKKFDLALLLLDKKKIAWISDAKEVLKGKDETDSKKLFLKEIEELKNISVQLGFCIKDTNIHEMYQEEDRLWIRYDAYLGKDEKDVNEFIDSVKTKISEEEDPDGFYNEVKNRNNMRIGILLGYPETAAAAYRSDKALNWAEISEDEKNKLQKEGVLKFLEFHPSQAHWQEELDFARENQKIIREKAPKLYQEIIESQN
jgi:hypothetical protein